MKSVDDYIRIVDYAMRSVGVANAIFAEPIRIVDSVMMRVDVLSGFVGNAGTHDGGERGFVRNADRGVEDGRWVVGGLFFF